MRDRCVTDKTPTRTVRRWEYEDVLERHRVRMEGAGDLMRRHPSGNYVVEGRKKDLINRGGEKISAEEIENLILSHPAVQNVACVPVPDPNLGEKMCACVVLKKNRKLELRELIEFLKDKEIAKFKLPERLEIFDDLPVSTFGKV